MEQQGLGSRVTKLEERNFAFGKQHDETFLESSRFPTHLFYLARISDSAAQVLLLTLQK